MLTQALSQLSNLGLQIIDLRNLFAQGSELPLVGGT